MNPLEKIERVSIFKDEFYAGEKNECVITTVLNYLKITGSSKEYISSVKRKFDSHPKNMKPGVSIEWLPKVLEDIVGDEFDVEISALIKKRKLQLFPEETRSKFKLLKPNTTYQVPNPTIIIDCINENQLHVYVLLCSSDAIIDSDGCIKNSSLYKNTTGFVKLTPKENIEAKK